MSDVRGEPQPHVSAKMGEFHSIPQCTRRDLLKGSLALASAFAVPEVGSAQDCAPKDGTVRDRLWLFGVPTNSDYPHLHQRSVMSAMEGAVYLSLSNLLMVQSAVSEAKYGHLDSPLAQYAVALRPLKRIAWSLVGGGGVTSALERAEVIALAKRTPNIVGLYMDDFFFTTEGRRKREGKPAALTLEELRQIRKELRTSGKHLPLNVTLYTAALDLPFLPSYLELIDIITLWTWKPGDLVNLGSYLEKSRKLAPHAKMMLGCYMVDYDRKASVSVSWMRQQCERGLYLLHGGRIEGIVFLGNTVEDLGYDAVEWTRQWIQKVGDERV